LRQEEEEASTITEIPDLVESSIITTRPQIVKECGSKGMIPLIRLAPSINKKRIVDDDFTIRNQSVDDDFTIRNQSVDDDFTIRNQLVDDDFTIRNQLVDDDFTIRNQLALDLVIDADTDIESIRHLIGELIVDVKNGRISMKKLYDIDVASSKIHNLLQESIKLLS
jgi:hypothetical protein